MEIGSSVFCIWIQNVIQKERTKRDHHGGFGREKSALRWWRWGWGALGGCSYVFNLVVGTGILALPSVLITGGWVRNGSLSLSCSVYPFLCLFCCSVHIVGACLCNSEFWDAMWASLSLQGRIKVSTCCFILCKVSLKAIPLSQPCGEGLWHTLQRGCWIQNHCKIHSRCHFVTVVKPAAIGGGVLVPSTSDPKHGTFNYYLASRVKLSTSHPLRSRR
jgi:hypothetical protein